MRLGAIVELTDAEVLIGSKVGKTRSVVGETAHLHDEKKGEQTREEGDVLGMLGELAFCKWANLYPDLSPTARCVGSADCYFRGFPVDVKTTKARDGALLAKPKLKDGNPFTLYVLVYQLSDYNYLIRGWAPHSILFQEKNLGDWYGWGECYRLVPEALAHIADLFELKEA